MISMMIVMALICKVLQGVNYIRADCEQSKRCLRDDEMMTKNRCEYTK